MLPNISRYVVGGRNIPKARKIPKKKQRFIIGLGEIILIIGMAFIIAVTLAQPFVSGVNPERTTASILAILFMATVLVVLAFLNGRMAKQ
jgi:uncharacterized membrane protein (DUF485 family)